MSETPPPARTAPDDEIDLLALVGALRPALVPALVAAMLLGAATYLYARSLEPLYAAQARFAIADPAAGGMAMPDLGGALSSLLPGGGGGNESERAEDKIMSRDFVVALFDETGIDEDPHFTGEGRAPGPVARVRAFLLGAEDPLTPAEVLGRIVRTYRETVEVTVNPNDVIDLIVSYPEPERAAALANRIVQAHLDDIDTGRVADDQRQVSLMENRLVAAQDKLDAAMQAARAFAVENSVRSREELSASSLRLDRFRREAERLDEVLAAIEALAGAGTAPGAPVDLARLGAEAPGALPVLQREFGWDPVARTAPAPGAGRLDRLRESIAGEREQLGRAIRSLEAEAGQNAAAAGRLAELEREIEVRQAVYTALVSQVEARSLGAALSDTRGEWIQKAAPPLEPSAPRKLMMSIAAAFIGFLVVLAGSLMRTARRGTVHSAAGFAPLLGDTPVVEAPGFGRRGRRTPSPGLVELVYELRRAGTRRVLVLGAPGPALVKAVAHVVAEGIADGTGTGTDRPAGDAAAAAADTATDRTVALVDLYRKGRPGAALHSAGTLEQVRRTDTVTVLRWIEQGPAKGATTLDEALTRLADRHHRLVIAGAGPDNGTLQNRIALDHADHVLLAFRTGTTKKDTVAKLRKITRKQNSIPINAILT